jgi:hypothetical protein
VKLADTVPSHVPPPEDVALLIAQILQHADAIHFTRTQRSGGIDVVSIECKTRRACGTIAMEVAMPRESLRMVKSFDPHAAMVRNLVVSVHDQLGI